MDLACPYLGHGIGLRTVHYPHVLDGTIRADWFEVISENFMIPGGRPLAVLDRARAAAPVALHGVSLSLGSVDPLNETYLDELAALVARVDPAWVSDHLCWGSVGGRYAHDLLPLPYTEEALAHVAERISRVQERIGRRMLVENVSSYLTYTHSAMPEWEFLAEVAARADCGILLDVNNVYVSETNQRRDPATYLAALPADRIVQIHLAGHRRVRGRLIDTHDAPVAPEVWDLYAKSLARFGSVPTMVEWDASIPVFDVLYAEVQKAGRHRAAFCGAIERAA
jgi:uncharacterized protein (UPF0276 family)